MKKRPSSGVSHNVGLKDWSIIRAAVGDMDLYRQCIEQGILASRNPNRVLVDCLTVTLE